MKSENVLMTLRSGFWQPKEISSQEGCVWSVEKLGSRKLFFPWKWESACLRCVTLVFLSVGTWRMLVKKDKGKQHHMCPGSCVTSVIILENRRVISLYVKGYVLASVSYSVNYTGSSPMSNETNLWRETTFRASVLTYQSCKYLGVKSTSERRSLCQCCKGSLFS